MNTVDCKFALDHSTENGISFVRENEHNVPWENPTLRADFVSDGIERGDFRLCVIKNQNQKKAFLCWFVEDGVVREFVGVSSFSEPGGPDLHTIFDVMEQIAKNEGCHSIRFHTLRKGMVKLSLENEYNVSSFTMRKYL